ncbi:MAG TPA: DUF3352 domain-containing protein [Candidatus Portnoybacteria bacterium]|nr:DUF3352 domain-containing protein [Candidatus Portnoybacteria bacterium]
MKENEKVKVNIQRRSTKSEENFLTEKVRDIKCLSLPQEKEEKINSRKILPIALAGALIVIVLVSAFFYWRQSRWVRPFAKLIPKEAISFSLLKVDTFSQNLAWLPAIDYLAWQSPLFEELKEKISQELKDVLSQANLDFKEEIKPLYEKELVLVTLPSAEGISWVLIIETYKDQKEKRGEVFSKIVKELKKRYYLSQEIYRQVEMTSLSPLSLNQGLETEIHYLWLDDFLIISDKIDSLKQVINTKKDPRSLSW